MTMEKFQLNYTYATLADWKLPEFGRWILRGCTLHKVGDVFVIARDGDRIAEVHPGDVTYLIIPEFGMKNSTANRWNGLGTNTMFATQKRTKVNGLHQYEVSRYARDSKGRGWVEVSKVLAINRIRLNKDGTLSTADVAQKVADKDSVKYRDFNKKLKRLKAVLFAQIRMGAYANLNMTDWKWSNKAREEVRTFAGVAKDDYHFSIRNFMYENIKEWVNGENPALTRNIALCCFLNHSSDQEKGPKDQERRVANAMKAVQVRYLQEHCVTIREVQPSPSVTNDQDRELQSTAGLREVQVPGQAQVC